MLMASRPGAPGRRGAVAFPWLILANIVVVAVLAFMQRLALRRHDQVELQAAVDAAARAAVASLADDHVLTNDPNARQVMWDGLWQNADRFARHNQVHGERLLIHDNPHNYTDGEIVRGGLTAADSLDFNADPKAGTPLDLYHPDLNAVRISLRRRRAGASATAFADHDVIGFYLRDTGVNPAAADPNGEPSADNLPEEAPPPLQKTVPMVPIALKADSWDRMITNRGGADAWHYDPTMKLPASGPDGIPELSVTLTGQPGGADDPLPVWLDPSAKPADFLRQVQRGVAFSDLRTRGGQLLLNDGTQKSNRVELPLQGLPADQMGALAQTFAGILGQPRVWMLYSEVRTDAQAGNQTAVVIGFVTARVMAIRGNPGGPQAGKASSYGPVGLTLQPCVMNVSTAVTNSRLRDLGPRTIFNPYIAKVRLVE
jgi:hypothetical protein